jgi:peptidoglycan-N-acetylglucosamine deacetylase
MKRRAFLAGMGLVAAGGATGATAGITAHDALSAESPSARTARPSGQGAFQSLVTFRTAPAGALIALTIDDGPTVQWTPQILGILQRYGARATFFRVGERALDAPDLVRRTADDGHEQGNHTWAHDDLTQHDENFDRATLERTGELLTRLTGRAPTMCRPPYGRIDSVGLLACAALRYDVALWSHHVTGSDPEQNVDGILQQVSAGSIVLAHDGGPEPNGLLIRQLDRLVGSLTAAGYTFVTVSELLSAGA